MRTCPKCGEINGDNNDHCYKCGEYIANQQRKICPHCGEIYTTKAEKCEYCETPLVAYNKVEDFVDVRGSGNSEIWIYICTILIPLIGIIIGCIRIGNDKESNGKTFIILGIVVIFVDAFLSLLILK